MLTQPDLVVQTQMQGIQLDQQVEEDVENALKAQTSCMRLDAEAAEARAVSLQVNPLCCNLPLSLKKAGRVRKRRREL